MMQLLAITSAVLFSMLGCVVIVANFMKDDEACKPETKKDNEDEK